MGLTAQQYAELLKPLSAARVATRKQGSSGPTLSYLEAWDVKAHLTRIFGFGGWSADVIDAGLVFEAEPSGASKNWNVAYRVTMRLTLHDLGCTYTEVAVGGAQLPTRWEAHDMAVKTAESDAIKRCAINLGTQFGLSLYDNGSRKDVIGYTVPVPEGAVVVEKGTVPEGAVERVAAATTLDELKDAWDDAVAHEYLKVVLSDGSTLKALIEARVAEIKAGDAA